MIEVRNVSRLYRSSTVETAALHDVSMDIQAGEFVAIMGPSGSGKSTLLNILGLLDRPTKGTYSLDGQLVSGLPERALARARRDRLGFIFQGFNLIDELTVEQNIDLALAYRGLPSSERRRRVSEAMDRVGIAHRRRHHPSQLSGGQQQRAAIARAIVGRPPVLLADEPTGNLDSANGAQVMGILRALNAEGSTIIMVTHSAVHADEARRVVHMLDGRVVLSASHAI